jgi:hypothetical protein
MVALMKVRFTTTFAVLEKMHINLKLTAKQKDNAVNFKSFFATKTLSHKDPPSQ